MKLPICCVNGCDPDSRSGMAAPVAKVVSVFGVRGSYAFNLSGGATVNTGVLQLGHTGGTTNNPTGRILNLTGTAGNSLLNVGSITYAAGIATVNWNGGKLRVTGATASSLPLSVSHTVKAGGAYLDTTGAGLTLGGALLHDATLGAVADG